MSKIDIIFADRSTFEKEIKKIIYIRITVFFFLDKEVLRKEKILKCKAIVR